MFALRRQRSVALFVALAVAGMALAMGVAYRLAERRVLHEESIQLERQLGLYAEGLQQRIDRYRTLPQVLALDPELRAALDGELAPADVERLNRKLERANSVTRASTLTLIDRHGIALAASNWREAASNVGEDYSFRPYVQQALASGAGHFYGIGLTTAQAGYFLSQAIVDERAVAIGVVVIKIELDALEREWLQTPDVVLVSDTHGVVFLASRDAWRYRTLAPLGDADRRELAATRQYADRELLPLAVEAPLRGADPLRPLRVAAPALPQPVLWRTIALAESGWRLHLLHDASAGSRSGRSAALAVGATWLALLFLVLFVQQRRRLAALRRRSRAELEAVLKQHAEELRTAQDGILAAVSQADRGLARSLQHLPQGVVVIDADLRVVAWNSRYVELFSMPADLVRVGRPIEDLFRYNARRGLLGPGPVEEAIERRLNHLRSGSPHMRESEKEDGTVLEIRGNPLPDGGFVTSYTDITSYKNAARELRSLADALEHRIEERTRALAEAKREAEEANRYKTRFVASAVHDLLQPLNAARMFLSVLRGRLEEASVRQIADHVDQALTAQDEILNSLLDIARLEAGTLQTQVRDFRLAPLLEALAREFGILAAGRGLSLEAVAAERVVRSDEALLRRIVQNFLSNAVRYTPSGRIVLGCRRSGDALRIEVHDQGPGIPESLQAQIFEEFRRLDDGGGHDRGAGLGLAIVERIGRLLGHRIAVRSRLGRGSVFSVTVPCGDAAAVRDEAVAAFDAGGDASPLHGTCVWCVDDDPRVCEATRALLQRWHCRVELAGGPHEARAACRPEAPPDLVLLDVRMGEIDGPALYAELCAVWAHAPPLILVTAERDPALREQAHRHGWGLLYKPVRPPALRALMMQLIVRHAR